VNRRIVIIASVVAALLLTLVALPRGPGRADWAGDVLADYYPGTSTGTYLIGYNYVSQPPSVTVLWNDRQDADTFRQHNWGPYQRCHTDQLSWWAEVDGYLRYVSTTDTCTPGQSTAIIYSIPIIFLPRTWSGSYWSLTGTSSATYVINGITRCTGTTAWKAEILGLETIAPNEVGLHWRTTQTTTWATGDVTGGCWAGAITHWQEDYWFVNDLPGPNGPAKGLKRTKGGNLDVDAGRWDIWFDRWAALP